MLSDKDPIEEKTQQHEILLIDHNSGTYIQFQPTLLMGTSLVLLESVKWNPTTMRDQSFVKSLRMLSDRDPIEDKTMESSWF